MKTYLIKVAHETEIEAENADRAKEIFFDEIDNFEECPIEFIEKNLVVKELSLH